MPPSTTHTAPARGLPDGRHERTRRTREALIRAYIEVAEQTGREPQAAEVAERVGCSLRTVFERFSSLNGLALAVFDTILQGARTTSIDKLLEADRMTRIRGHIEVRVGVCERWYPLWRVLLRSSHDCEELEDQLDTVRKLTRARLERVYQRELDMLSGSSRAALLIALESVLDFSVWGRMRQRQGLSVEQAKEVWIESVNSLLPPTPAN